MNIYNIYMNIWIEYACQNANFEIIDVVIICIEMIWQR